MSESNPKPRPQPEPSFVDVAERGVASEIIATPYTGLFIAASCNSRSRFNSGTPVSRNRIMVRLLPEKNFSFQSTCAYLCYLLRPRALRPMRITNLGVSIFRLHASTSLCSAPIVFRNCLLEIPRDNCRDTPALACVRWTRTFEQRPPASSFENPRGKQPGPFSATEELSWPATSVVFGPP